MFTDSFSIPKNNDIQELTIATTESEINLGKIEVRIGDKVILPLMKALWVPERTVVLESDPTEA